MNSLYGALAPSIQFTTTLGFELGDCGYKKKKVKEEEERDEKRDQIFLVNSSIYIIFFLLTGWYIMRWTGDLYAGRETIQTNIFSL